MEIEFNYNEGFKNNLKRMETRYPDDKKIWLYLEQKKKQG